MYEGAMYSAHSPLKVEYLVQEERINYKYSKETVTHSAMTNNWAGTTRSGLLPPLKQKIHQTVQNLPVIPPISGKLDRSNTTEDLSEAANKPEDQDNPDERAVEARRTKSRNKHLVKLYCVSFIQLLLVLVIVVVFTEINEVRKYSNANSWISKISIILMLVFICTWITVVVCFPWAKHKPAYNVTILVFFTICEGLLLGVMSANTERMNNDINTIFSSKNDTQMWNISLTDPNVIFNESLADITFDPSLQNLTTKELNNESDEFKVVRLEKISDMLGIELFISLSTASLSVTFCLIVCVFFVLLCLQEKFDGDFLGGLFYAFFVICLSVLFLMLVTARNVWPQLWYGGLGAFFLWFFHRMVVFPLIALILPYTSIQAYRVNT